MQFISEKGCTLLNALFSDWLNGSAFCRQSYANLKKLATTVRSSRMTTNYLIPSRRSGFCFAAHAAKMPQVKVLANDLQIVESHFRDRSSPEFRLALSFI
jgi:hypothetical protein